MLTSYPALDPDRVHVVHNGIDIDLYRPVAETDVVEQLGIDLLRPAVVFVGRITRQKGVPHLLRAALAFDDRAQIVLLAGAPTLPSWQPRPRPPSTGCVIGAAVSSGSPRCCRAWTSSRS